MLWKFRFRSPGRFDTELAAGLPPAFKGMNEVVIEVDTPGRELEVAQDHIARYFSPGMAVIENSLTLFTVHSEKAMMRARAGAYGEAPAAPAAPAPPARPSPAAKGPRVPTRTTAKNHRRGATAADSRPAKESRGEAGELDAMAGGRIGD